MLQTSCRFILRKYTSGIGILNQNVIKMASSENASVHDNQRLKHATGTEICYGEAKFGQEKLL